MKRAIAGLGLLGLLAGGMPCIAAPADWAALDDQAALNEGYTSQYDRNSLKYDSATGHGTIWTRQVYPPGTEGYKKGFYSLTFQYEIDCANHQVRSLQILMDFLNEDMDFDDEPTEWQPIRPKTIAEEWYGYVCP